MVQNDLKRLCRRLGYEFKNIKLLKQALTHCSMGDENNQRLEFLGDSILSFVIANALFDRFPDESEGKLSRLRAFLVKGESLAEIASDLSLGDYLYLGPGELRSGGHRRASILADALEAIIASVYLDGGVEASASLILRLYTSKLDDKILQENLKDYKTVLQEFLQAKKKPLPTYELTHTEGDEHDQVFHVTCTVAGLPKSFSSSGPSRRKAEQEVAKQWIAYLKKS